MHTAINCTYTKVYFTTFRSMLLHMAMGSISGGVSFTTYSSMWPFRITWQKHLCPILRDAPK
jgi:hypothetical protein